MPPPATTDDPLWALGVGLALTACVCSTLSKITWRYAHKAELQLKGETTSPARAVGIGSPRLPGPEPDVKGNATYLHQSIHSDSAP